MNQKRRRRTKEKESKISFQVSIWIPSKSFFKKRKLHRSREKRATMTPTAIPRTNQTDKEKPKLLLELICLPGLKTRKKTKKFLLSKELLFLQEFLIKEMKEEYETKPLKKTQLRFPPTTSLPHHTWS
jgi:hypothetical protein